MLRQDHIIVLWNHLIRGGSEKTIAGVFNWHTGKLLVSLSCILPPTPPRHSVFARSIVLSPDGKYIAAALHRELQIDADKGVEDEEPYQITTYVWSVEARAHKPMWTTVSVPLTCFNYSNLAISFPVHNRLCCPSGIFDIVTGRKLGDLDALLCGPPCTSLSFRKFMAALIRCEGWFEVWRLQGLSFEQIQSVALWDLMRIEEADEALLPCSILDISHSSQFLALWGLDKMVLLVNIPRCWAEKRYIEPQPEHLALRFSPDEKEVGILATGMNGKHRHYLLNFDIESGNRKASSARPSVFTSAASLTCKVQQLAKFSPTRKIITVCYIVLHLLPTMKL
jgi:hypothetical protein